MPDNDKVNAVTVKLPAVWTANIVAWFTQAEAQFGLRGVTQDETRYWHVVAALDGATATRAACFLEEPPSQGKYEGLKAFLLSVYDLSEQQRAQQLLSIRDLGDRRPSELMDTMLRLHGKHDSQCYLFKEVFLRALPPAVRQGISNSQEKDMRKLAAEADRIFGACASQSVHAATSLMSPGIDDRLQELYPVSRPRDRRNEESRSRDDMLCYFHRRFGAAARQCRQPCVWRQGNARAGPR